MGWTGNRDGHVLLYVASLLLEPNMPPLPEPMSPLPDCDVPLMRCAQARQRCHQCQPNWIMQQRFGSDIFDMDRPWVWRQTVAQCIGWNWAAPHDGCQIASGEPTPRMA